jgi:hypothetical protein
MLSFFGTNVLLSNLFPDSLSLHSSVNVTDEASDPHRFLDLQAKEMITQ